MNEMKTAAVHNLGCKVNSYELDVMIQELIQDGYQMVTFDEKADLYIINTCSVTNIADRKSRQMLHKAKKQNPDAVVVAVGCYVETDRQQIEKDEAIDLAIGNNNKGRIAQILAQYMEQRKEGAVDKTLGGSTMENIAVNSGASFESMHLETTGRTRADIKIQDGCTQFCTYCIIPYARGTLRSRDVEEIVEEIKELASHGTKEVVLTGIHICSFGRDKGLQPEKELLSLLTRINMIAGIERIRLGSLEPRIMTEEFVKGISTLSKLCPHFHMSLQSGCDETLRRMNRHYTSEEFYHSIELLRRYFDEPAITTDVIVGFPGETKEEFEASRAFCEKVRFFEMHVFKYSIRHGTPAATMPNQLTNAQKSERSDVLLDLTARQADEYRAQFLGKQEKVILEEPIELEGQSYYVGHTMRYVQCLVSVSDLETMFGKRESFQDEIVEGVVTAAVAGTPYLVLQPEIR